MLSFLNEIIPQIGLSAAETVILYSLFKAFLHRSRFSGWVYGTGLFAYFVFQLITYLNDCPLFSTAYYYFGFTVLLAVIFFSDTFAVKMITSYLFVVLNYSCKLVSATVMSKLYHIPLPQVPFELVLIPQSQILACLLFLIFIGLIIAFRNLRLHKKDTLYSIITYTMPTGILLLIMQQFTDSARRQIEFVYLDAAGILFFTALAMFYLIDKTVVIDETKNKNAIIAQLLEMQQNYYKSIEVSQKEIASIRHDIKKHMHSVVYMLEHEEYTSAKDYIEKLYTTANQLSSPIYSGNNMVDIILNQNVNRARELGIKIDMNVMVPADLSIEDTDICIILGNLLDNAMEACMRMDKEYARYITLQIQQKKAYLYICISNSYNGEVKFVNNIYESVKVGERFCGIGISNVKKVVEKYQGEINLSHSDSEFTVKAMLLSQFKNSYAPKRERLRLH